MVADDRVVRTGAQELTVGLDSGRMHGTGLARSGDAVDKLLQLCQLLPLHGDLFVQLGQ